MELLPYLGVYLVFLLPERGEVDKYGDRLSRNEPSADSQL